MKASLLSLLLLGKERARVMRNWTEATRKSFGYLVNSFTDLEPDYVRNALGRPTWLAGPLFSIEQRQPDGDRSPCMEWLDGFPPNSVIYVCFGSLGRFGQPQRDELSAALDSSGHPFMWVVRDDGGEHGMERVGEKGVIVRGWVPQVRVLVHEAVGGFVTHCGWNSIMEGVVAGVPMVTWPLFADQGLNERLVVDVHGVGVAVGVERCHEKEEERGVVGRESIREAIVKVMGEDGEVMRQRVRELGVKGKKALKEGGESWDDVEMLLEVLKEESKGRRDH